MLCIIYVPSSSRIVTFASVQQSLLGCERIVTLNVSRLSSNTVSSLVEIVNETSVLPELKLTYLDEA